MESRKKKTRLEFLLIKCFSGNIHFTRAPAWTMTRSWLDPARPITAPASAKFSWAGSTSRGYLDAEFRACFCYILVTFYNWRNYLGSCESRISPPSSAGLAAWWLGGLVACKCLFSGCFHVSSGMRSFFSMIISWCSYSDPAAAHVSSERSAGAATTSSLISLLPCPPNAPSSIHLLIH